MRYTFVCEDCGHREDISLPVDRRNDEQFCYAPAEGDSETPCYGVMKRDFGGEMRTKLVTSPKYWCDSTASDFLPTLAEARAADKEAEQMAANIQKKPSRKEFFNELRRDVAGVEYRAERPEEVIKKAAAEAARSAA